MSFYNEEIYDEGDFKTCTTVVIDQEAKWRRDCIYNKVFVEMNNLRITRYNLLNAGLNADVILLRELISNQLTTKTKEDSIDRMRILFGYILMTPDFLLKNPKLLTAVRRQVDVLSADPNASLLLPMLERLRETLG